MYLRKPPAPCCAGGCCCFTGGIGSEGYTRHSNSQMRNVIAKRLGKQIQRPHLSDDGNQYGQCDHGPYTVERTLARLRSVFNDLVVKPAHSRCCQHPAINFPGWVTRSAATSMYISVAVAIEDGLIVRSSVLLIRKHCRRSPPKLKNWAAKPRPKIAAARVYRVHLRFPTWG